MKRKITIQIISALLIVIFIYAAMSKLMNYSLFIAQLHTHPYLKNITGFVAWAIPATEIIVSLLLIYPTTRFVGLFGATALLLAFTAYLGIMLLSEKDLPCSCGNIINGLSWSEHLIFNLILITLTIAAILIYKQRFISKRSVDRAHPVQSV